VKILDSHKLKKLLFRKDTTNKADKIIRSEIASLKRISHPNIIKLIEVIEDEE
jgi:serine/threonine protein kinase